MSVNPGFGGQTFIPRSESKVRPSARCSTAPASRAPIEVDGGIDASNAARVVAAGATILVAGQAIFGSADAERATRDLRAAASPRSRCQMTSAPSSTSLVRVRYAETDKMGVVYYANYFVWFEVGRTRPAAGARLELPRDGGWRACRCRSSRRTASTGSPARYDDELEIRTTGRLLSPVRLEFDYEVRLAAQAIVAGDGPHGARRRSTRPAGRAGCRNAIREVCSHEGTGHRRRRLHRLDPRRARCSTAAPR